MNREQWSGQVGQVTDDEDLAKLLVVLAQAPTDVQFHRIAARDPRALPLLLVADLSLVAAAAACV